MLVLGWKHNSQGEFYDTGSGVIDYVYVARLFVSWYLLVFVAGSVFSIAVAWSMKAIRQRTR